MEKVETSEITLRIPPSIAADIKNSEIVALLLDKALGKRDFYKSKIRVFESKYGTNFASFKKKSEKGVESFKDWDDLLLWEGFLLAYDEWNRKYEDLRLCMT